MPNPVKQRRSKDLNEIAHQLVAQSRREEISSAVSKYVAEIGSRSGQIGGKRRLETMTAAERRKAAKARWNKPKQ